MEHLTGLHQQFRSLILVQCDVHSTRAHVWSMFFVFHLELEPLHVFACDHLPEGGAQETKIPLGMCFSHTRFGIC